MRLVEILLITQSSLLLAPHVSGLFVPWTPHISQCSRYDVKITLQTAEQMRSSPAKALMSVVCVINASDAFCTTGWNCCRRYVLISAFVFFMKAAFAACHSALRTFMWRGPERPNVCRLIADSAVKDWKNRSSLNSIMVKPVCRELEGQIWCLDHIVLFQWHFSCWMAYYKAACKTIHREKMYLFFWSSFFLPSGGLCGFFKEGADGMLFQFKSLSRSATLASHSGDQSLDGCVLMSAEVRHGAVC